MNFEGDHSFGEFLGTFLEASITVAALSFAFFTLENVEQNFDAWAIVIVFLVGLAAVMNSAHALRSIAALHNVPRQFKFLYRSWATSALLIVLVVLGFGFLSLGIGPFYYGVGTIAQEMGEDLSAMGEIFIQGSGVDPNQTPESPTTQP